MNRLTRREAGNHLPFPAGDVRLLLCAKANIPSDYTREIVSSIQ